MDTENSVVMVKGKTKEERMGGICNSVNNKSENKNPHWKQKQTQKQNKTEETWVGQTTLRDQC